MRINDQANIPAAGRINGDMISRLAVGDVIRAKILEITSDEALLKLIDGTLLRAETVGRLDAQPGQTLSFSVASRKGGTVILDAAAGEIHESAVVDEHAIKDILRSSGIKDTPTNTRLALEFIKANVPVTAENIERAFSLIESGNSVNIEKAVFLLSRTLDTKHIDIELISRLMDGRLKLGEQLNELLTSIKDTAKLFRESVPSPAPISDQFFDPDRSPVPPPVPAPALGAERIEKLAQEIEKLFKNAGSDKLSRELDTNRLFDELDEKLEIIKAVTRDFEALGSKDIRIIRTAADNVEGTAKLLNQLHSAGVYYYQLPVSIAGRGTTSELYVMKRRNSKRKIDPQNIVMFLSLDTANIGRIETLLDVKGKNICLSFRTENQRINDFICEKIQYLYTSLRDSGYKLSDIRYAVMDSAASPLSQDKLLTDAIGGNNGRIDFYA